jgi:tetratricopeptide (TPR) repeat protein
MKRLLVLAAGAFMVTAGPAQADDRELCISGLEHDLRADACTRILDGSSDPHIQAVAYINRANARMRMGNLDEALADADKAIALEPDLAGANGKRGIIHFAHRDMDKAIADFTAELARDPKDVETLVNRAVAYFEKDANAASIADMTAAIKLSPPTVMLYTHRAAMHLDSGDIPRAVADYKQALKLDPGNERVKAQLKDLDS